MRMVSNLTASHRGELSALAIAETVAMSGASLWVAVRYETLLHIAVAAILASLLLFRTRQSDRLCQRWSSQLETWRFRAFSPRGPWTWSYAWRNWCFPFGLVAIRAAGIVASFTRRPLVHFIAIRKNWRRLALCTDFATPVEAIPGAGFPNRTFLPYGSAWPLTSGEMWAELRSRFRPHPAGNKPGLNRGSVRFWLGESLMVLSVGVAGGILLAPALLQRLSFKSVAVLFLPLLFVVNSDVIRPDLKVADRLKEFAQDNASRLKAAWSILMVVVVGGSLALQNFAATLYTLGEEHLSVVGRTLCEYYVPPGGLVTVKVWQLASLVNAVIFLYMFLIYVPRMIRRSRFEPPGRFVPAVKTILWRVDVVTICLSLYALVCGLAIVLAFVITHHFPKKQFQFFPVVG